MVMTKTLDRVLGVVLEVFIVVMVLVVILQVLARYAFRVSIPWTEEAARYMLAYLTFVGAAIALKEGKHIVVTFLYERLSPGTRWSFDLAFHLLILLFLLAILKGGLTLLQELGTFHRLHALDHHGPGLPDPPHRPHHHDLVRVGKPLGDPETQEEESMIGLTAALIGLFTFFLIGLPVAFSLGISGLISLAFMEGGIEKVNFTILAQRIFYGPNSFLILAIPFFLLAGKLMNTGGITERIYSFARSLVGHFKGGLGHVNVVASMIFAGMTGVATSEAAGLGVVEIKAMKDAGYDEDFAVAVAASSSCMGPIIPPSVALVVYGVLASTSVGRLLIGGVVPGVMTGIALMITVYIFAIRRDYPRDVKSNFREMRTRFSRAVWPMMTPVILIGGMLAGIFTPTEAAGVAVLYAFVLGCLVYREISFADLRRILRETAVETAVITFIVSCAMLYGWIMIRSQIPVKLAEYLMSLTTNPVGMLMILNVFFLIVGCFMETLAAMTILVPILIPMIHKLGIDPVHFGLVMVFNLVIGLLTPPFGLVLFVMARISGVPLPRIVRAVAPFYIPLFVVLLLITFYKPFVTFLPDLLMGRAR